MTMLSDGIALRTFPAHQAEAAYAQRRTYAAKRLTGVFKGAVEAPFDDSSRLVFMSDLHRGDGSKADGFARNRELVLRTLTHYYDEGFSYVEVGDGDELWKNWRFEDICRAHGPVFDLLHKYKREDRLHLIVGNHDARNGRNHRVEKDGLTAHEGLILRHSRTGQQIFVVHGHQADLKSDYLSRVSRLAVGYIWKRLQLLGLAAATSEMGRIWKLKPMERSITEWLQAHRQIVICGHTHRPMSAVYGAPPYFNAGSCVFPGCITALELQDGEIRLVSWFIRGKACSGKAVRIERQPVAPPRKLHTLVL
jgi:UDP-2,3-diacylglucosamine pyrophosphatase LpxH